MKKSQKNAYRTAHCKIFKHLVDYVIGPKWDNAANYQIGSLKSTKNTLGIIAIDGGYARCTIWIYFYITKIHVYISHKDPYRGFIDKTDYSYTDFDAHPLEESEMNDYILQTNMFLQELIRHCAYTHNSPYDSDPGTSLADYQSCIADVIPDTFPVPFGSYGALSYHYDSADTETISIMTNVFKSKAFKRYRGDNK